MEITYASNWLKKRCDSEREANKEWGPQVANKLRLRLAELKAAARLNDISPHRPARLHELGYNRAAQLAVDLHGGFRLVFEPSHNPVPTKPDGGLDRDAVTAIRITEVGDYHDD